MTINNCHRSQMNLTSTCISLKSFLILCYAVFRGSILAILTFLFNLINILTFCHSDRKENQSAQQRILSAMSNVKSNILWNSVLDCQLPTRWWVYHPLIYCSVSNFAELWPMHHSNQPRKKENPVTDILSSSIRLYVTMDAATNACVPIHHNRRELYECRLNGSLHQGTNHPRPGEMLQRGTTCIQLSPSWSLWGSGVCWCINPTSESALDWWSA